MSRASARVAKVYGIPMLGLPGSKHQEACELEGVGFIPGPSASPAQGGSAYLSSSTF